MADDGTKRLTVRLPHDIYDRLRALAHENDRSINMEIVRTLRRALRDGPPPQNHTPSPYSAPDLSRNGPHDGP